MGNIDHVTNVFVPIEKELWKAAKVLAVQRERPVKVLVADGLRLLLKEAGQAGSST